MNPTVREASSVSFSSPVSFSQASAGVRADHSPLNESDGGPGDCRDSSIETLRTVYPYRKPQVIIVGAPFRDVPAREKKNNRLKAHTKSTAEALRTRSSPAPPWCCCGCPPPRPAPVDSSWSNLEKLVSYSLRAREKPRRDAKRSVSHAFIRSSFDALARSLAPRRGRREKPGSSSFARAGAGEPRVKIPPPVSRTSERTSTRRRRDETRGIDEENYLQRTRVFPPLDRSPRDAFRPRRSSAKRVSRRRGRESRREDERVTLANTLRVVVSRDDLTKTTKRTSSSATSRVQPHRRVRPAPTST